MKLRRMFSVLSTICGVMVLMGSVVACSSDSDNDDPKPQATFKKVIVEAEFVALNNLTDVTEGIYLNMMDFNGETIESLVPESGEKSSSITTTDKEFPKNAKVALEIIPNEEYEFPAGTEAVTLGYELVIRVNILDTKGDVLVNASRRFTKQGVISEEENVLPYLENAFPLQYDVAISINENGEYEAVINQNFN